MAKPLPFPYFYALLTFGERGELTWATAPLAYFDSDRDHRRWNERFAGQPVDQATDAYRIRWVETPHAKKRWHLQFVVGVQAFSMSGYGRREAAELRGGQTP